MFFTLRITGCDGVHNIPTVPEGITCRWRCSSGWRFLTWPLGAAAAGTQTGSYYLVFQPIISGLHTLSTHLERQGGENQVPIRVGWGQRGQDNYRQQLAGVSPHRSIFIPSFQHSSSAGCRSGFQQNLSALQIQTRTVFFTTTDL